MFHYRHLLAAASLLGLAAAQTSTSCNPLNTTNCPADPAFGTEANWNFNATPNFQLWETVTGNIVYNNETGAAFTVAKQGDSPTIRTTFYIFFGRVEVWLKAAPGQGIVSSTMLLSDDLDEIDWEFLGVNNSEASTNYFGKGFQDYLNADLYTVPGGSQDDYHNYTTDWTKDQIDWYIDGTHVRSLSAQDANQTRNYPQTPMRLSIGIWAGGDPNNAEGTIEWAGGITPYDDGPYTMYVQSCAIKDYSSGKEYVYGNESGTWESIQIVSGNSSAYEALNAVATETLAEKWAALPSGTKIGIYCAGGAVGAAIIAASVFFCVRMRSKGLKEAKMADETEKANRMELDKMKDGGESFAFSENTEYDPQALRNHSIANSSATNVAAAGVSPLDSKAWSRKVESPLQSPVPLLQDDSHGPQVSSPTASSFRDVPGSHAAPGAFDFNLPSSPEAAVVPARSASPAMSSRSRLSSSGQGMQRMQSPGPFSQVRNFGASHAGYQGLPGNDS